jgi:chromate reductase, NAD(P)H dehydrogenase (quinone)
MTRGPTDVRALLIRGSPRPGSLIPAAQRTVAALDAPGVDAQPYEGLTALPACSPEQQPVPPVVLDALAQTSEADGVPLPTPQHAGGLPGSLKELLDRTVAGGDLHGRPGAWLDVAHPDRRTGCPPVYRTGGVALEGAEAVPEPKRAMVALLAVIRGSPSRASA